MKKILSILSRQKLFVIFVIVFVVAACSSEYFLTYTNFVNLLTQVAAYGIVTCGMLFIIICGEFDISVGSVMCFASTVAVTLINATSLPFIVIMLIVLALAVGIGCLYGVLVIKLGISSFIATLAGMVFYRGIAYMEC